MKKILYIIGLLTLCCLSVVALADAPNVTLFMANWVKYNSNDIPQTLPAITVTDLAGGGITPVNGVTIILPKDMDILWDKSVSQVTVDGTTTAAVTYDKTLKKLTVPVSKTFAANEAMVITGQKVRIYDRAYPYQNLQLDVDGDGVSDATGANGIQMDDTNRATDFLPPYPIASLTTSVTGNVVTLSWENPPDPDYNGLLLTRTLTRGGQVSSPKEIQVDRLALSYADSDALIGDSIQYSLKTKDNLNNWGDAVNVTVQVAAEQPVVPPAEGDTETTTLLQTPPAPASVLDAMTQADIDGALAKYSDLKSDTANLKEIVYLVKVGILTSKTSKLNIQKGLTYASFTEIAGKALSVELQEGSYLKTFKKLRYIQRGVKASKKVTRKAAFKALLALKGKKVKNQTFEDYAKLRGTVTRLDIAVWVVKLMDAK